ncbi:MAG: hypothetical protein J7K69_04565 [Thermotogae bacterium]|nr:hypothetical protein [Thermotogota bacterium]
MAKADIGKTLKAPFELLVHYPIIGIPPLIASFVSLLMILAVSSGGIAMFGFRMFILSVVEWGVVLAMQGWLVAILDEILVNEKVDLKNSWFKVMEVFGSLLITGLIVSILTSVGMTFFIIPGILIMVSLSVAIPAIVKKKLGVTDSLRESINFIYSQGNFWIILLIIVIGVLLSFIPFIGAVLGSFLTSLWIPYAYLKYSE